jgi:hypothetical protein
MAIQNKIQSGGFFKKVYIWKIEADAIPEVHRKKRRYSKGGVNL